MPSFCCRAVSITSPPIDRGLGEAFCGPPLVRPDHNSTFWPGRKSVVTFRPLFSGPPRGCLRSDSRVWVFAAAVPPPPMIHRRTYTPPPTTTIPLTSSPNPPTHTGASVHIRPHALSSQGNEAPVPGFGSFRRRPGAHRRLRRRPDVPKSPSGDQGAAHRRERQQDVPVGDRHGQECRADGRQRYGAHGTWKG
jgi:hypothetical protein